MVDFAEFKQISENNQILFGRLMKKLAIYTQSVSSANCSIKIDTLEIQQGKSCLVNLQNICETGEDVSSLFLSVLHENLHLLNKEQQDQIEKTFNMKFTDVDWKSPILTRCDVYANVENKIVVDKMNIGVCDTTSFFFSNVGSARANCTILTVFETLAQLEKPEAKNFDVQDFFFVFVFVFVLLTLGLLYLFFYLLSTRYRIPSQKVKVRF